MDIKTDFNNLHALLLFFKRKLTISYIFSMEPFLFQLSRLAFFLFILLSRCFFIAGASLDLVRTAKLVLDEYFSLSSTPIHEDTQV